MKEDRKNVNGFILMGFTQDSQMLIILFLVLLIIFMANKWGKKQKQWQTLFSWAPKSLQMVTTAMKLKETCSLEENYDKSRQHIKKQKHNFVDKAL